MKILQVTPFFSPLHGGSAEVPYQLSRELARRGHQLTIYASDYKLGQEYISALTDIEIVVFKSWFNRVKFHVTPAIVSKLRENTSRFDIIHLHNYFTFQNIIAHRYARKNRIPYVLQAHGSVSTYFQRGILKRIFHKLWGHRILRDAVKILAVTPLEARQYLKLGAGKDNIAIIPHGIDLTEFSDLPRRGEFRQEYGFGDSQKLVLFLGRIDRVKGLDLLARAFSDLVRQIADARLVMVGPDDGYLAELKKLVKELNLEAKVLFTGPLHGKDKLKAYVDADVFVLPSSYEIFGITALEALACGTPVVISDRCGLAETLAGRAGLTVPYEVNALRDALLQLLNDDKMRQEFAENGKKLVREQFDWKNIVAQVEQLYSEARRW